MNKAPVQTEPGQRRQRIGYAEWWLGTVLLWMTAVGVPSGHAGSPAEPASNYAVQLASATPPTRSGLAFSNSPRDTEFLHAGLFAEPLAPVATTTPEENQDLAHALLAYRDAMLASGGRDAVEPLLAFLTAHPTSAWAPALELNLGLIYRQTGHFSKALQVWQAGWNSAQTLSDPKGRALADAMVARLSQLEAYLGRKELLRPLLTSLEGRPMGGTASQLLTDSHTGLYEMTEHPGESFRCGPLALLRILRHQDPHPSLVALHVLEEDSPSTDHGLSLTMVQKIAQRAGMAYQMAYRSTDAPVILPAVAHWNVGHYAAVVAQDSNGHYMVQDSTFGEDIRVSPSTLNEESSGYFLVPKGPLPSGWRRVSGAEGSRIWGRGDTGQDHDSGATGKCCRKNTDDNSKDKPNGGQGTPGQGYTISSVELEVVGLQLSDTPVGYAPPVGPSVLFSLVYSHRDTQQPTTFSYTNFGAKWTFSWLSYITDSVNSSASALLYQRGGGNEPFTFASTSATTAYPGPYSQSILTRTVSGGSTTGFTLTHRDGSYEEYQQASGNQFFLTAVADQAGNIVTLTYDSSMRITAITDAVGQVSTLTYGSASAPLQVTKITDPFGRSATFTYNAGGLLASITDVLGITSSYAYGQGSDADFISTLTTPYGSTSFTYGDSSTNSGLGSTRFLKTVDPLGRTSYVEYSQSALPGDTNGGGNLTNSSLLPSGMNVCNEYLYYRNTFIFDPDEYALATATGTLNYSYGKVIHWLHSSDTTNTSRVEESEKEPLENRVWYNYPAQTSCVQFTVSSGGVVTNGASNRPSAIGRVVDSGSTQLMTYAYNSQGNVTGMTDPVGRQWTYTYASNGIDLLTASNTTRGSQVLENRTYNSDHLPLTITGANGKTQHFAYNAAGQLMRYTDPLGYVTSLAYDSSGHLKSLQRPISSAKYTFSYDSVGRIEAATDPAGSTLRYTYDAADRPLTTTYPDSTTSKLAYTLLDLTSSTDRLSQTTRYKYDDDRELLTRTDPDNNSVTWGYDSTGHVTSITDSNGHATSVTLDAEGRITAKTFANGKSSAITYESSQSLVAELTDALSQITTYTYNLDNTVSTVSYSANLSTPSVSFTYDSAFRRPTSMTDGIGTTSYLYYPLSTSPVLGAGLLESVTSPLAGSSNTDTVVYSYDALNRVVGQSVNGVSQTTGFDALGRPTSVSNLLDTFTYGYSDGTARVTSVSSTAGPTAAATYFGATGDELLEQVNYTTHSGSTSLAQFGYTYNADDLVKTLAVSSPTAQTTTYAYDIANRLVSGVVGGTTEYAYGYDRASNLTSITSGGTTGSYTYTSTNAITSGTYDGNGSPLSLGGKTYKWDGANRLVHFTNTSAGTASTFVYDGLGRLVRVVDTAAGAITADHTYLWCGSVQCAAHDNTQAGSPISTRYFGQGTITSGAPYYYVRDRLGSVSELVTSSGIIASQFTYDPYGNRTTVSGTVIPDVGYAGYFYHAVSGLDFALYRAYDAVHARWLNRDPIGEAGGFNLYAYANNTPVSQVDSLGLKPGECYPTMDAAAANALNDINGQSIARNKEYQGMIYQNSDGSYSYTAPTTNEQEGWVDEGDIDSNTRGTYHTHGDAVPPYAMFSNYYSMADIGNAVEDGLYVPGWASYLGTPSGTFWRFDPNSYVGDPSTTTPPNMDLPQSSTVTYDPVADAPCKCGKK